MKTQTKRKLLRKDAPSINKVMGYKNEAVVERISKDLNLSKSESEELFNDMIRFLYIARSTNIKPVSPPKMIDEAWHIFIIYTQDYAKFCEKYFSSFIHHRPHRPEEKHGPEGGTNCRKLAQSFFGDDLSENWKNPINGGCEDCNECNSSCKGFSCNSCSGDSREECCV